MNMHNWRNQAACRDKDPEIFFLEDHSQSVETAKAICRHCPVTDACMQDSIRTGDYHGIRAGLPGSSRRRIAGGHPVIGTRGDTVENITADLSNEGWTVMEIAGYLGIGTRSVERARARNKKTLGLATEGMLL